MTFKNEMQLDMICPISFCDKETGIVDTRERMWATHRIVYMCMHVCCGVKGGTGQAWRRLSSKDKNVRSPLVPCTSAHAAAYAEDYQVCNSCKMQGASKLRGAGETEASVGCAFAAGSSCGPFIKKDAGSACWNSFCIALSILCFWDEKVWPRRRPQKPRR